jgi:hypothetical protein
MPPELLNCRMPSQLLEFQENATGKMRYALIDLIEDHVQSKGGTEAVVISALVAAYDILPTDRVEQRVHITN